MRLLLWLKARYSEAGAEIVTGLLLAYWGGYVLWYGADIIDDQPNYVMFGLIWGLKHWAWKFLILGSMQVLVAMASQRRWPRGIVSGVVAWCSGIAAAAFYGAPLPNTIWVFFNGLSLFNLFTILYFIAMWWFRRRSSREV